MAFSKTISFLFLISLVLANSNVLSKAISATKHKSFDDQLSDINKSINQMDSNHEPTIANPSLNRRDTGSEERDLTDTPTTTTPKKATSTAPPTSAVTPAPTVPKSTSSVSPQTNPSLCEEKVLLMYTDNTKDLKPQTVTEAVKWCNGISDDSCCTLDMFNKLKSYYLKDIDFKTNNSSK